MGGIVDMIFGGNDAPDPAATAQAQGTANIEAARATTAMNRANQFTPWGSQTWSQDPNNPDAWASTVSLSPEQQALMDQQNRISTGLGGVQEAALGRVQNLMGQGIDYGALPGALSFDEAMAKGGAGLYNPTQMYGGAEALTGKTRDAAWQATGNLGNQLARAMPGVERLGAVQDYTGPQGAMPTSADAYRKQVQDALYSQQQSRLDPRFAQASSDLESRLAAQGITQGSEAYNREIANLGRERTDAYQQAMNQAITGGEAATSAQFARDLASRQQGTTEANLEFQNALAGRGQDLSALGQYFNQAMAGRQQGTSEYNAALAGALGAQQGLTNTAQLGLQTAAAQPAIAQSYSNLSSGIRNQALNEQLQQRANALNELNALRSGAQVTTPQFGSTQSGAQVGAAPVAQSVWNAYNADQAGSNSLMSGLTSLGSAALMSPAGTITGLLAGI